MSWVSGCSGGLHRGVSKWSAVRQMLLLLLVLMHKMLLLCKLLLMMWVMLMDHVSMIML